MSYIVEYSETVDDVELTNEMDGELVGLDGTNIYNHLSVKRNKSFIYMIVLNILSFQTFQKYLENKFSECINVIAFSMNLKTLFFPQRTTVSKWWWMILIMIANFFTLHFVVDGLFVYGACFGRGEAV